MVCHPNYQVLGQDKQFINSDSADFVFFTVLGCNDPIKCNFIMKLHLPVFHLGSIIKTNIYFKNVTCLHCDFLSN